MDPIWDFLFEATRYLRCEGMSSDESGAENGGAPYYIRIREWRSRDLIPYLQLIDGDRKRVNSYGNIKPGNPARERTRIAAGTASKRRAIPELPLNFYDKTWYATLSRRDRALLKAGPALDLPLLVAYD